METTIFLSFSDQEILPKHSHPLGWVQKRRPIHLQRRKVSQLLSGEKSSCSVTFYRYCCLSIIIKIIYKLFHLKGIYYTRMAAHYELQL